MFWAIIGGAYVVGKFRFKRLSVMISHQRYWCVAFWLGWVGFLGFPFLRDLSCRVESMSPTAFIGPCRLYFLHGLFDCLIYIKWWWWEFGLLAQTLLGNRKKYSDWYLADLYWNKFISCKHIGGWYNQYCRFCWNFGFVAFVWLLCCFFSCFTHGLQNRLVYKNRYPPVTPVNRWKPVKTGRFDQFKSI
jgi:hypothetical protein